MHFKYDDFRVNTANFIRILEIMTHTFKPFEYKRVRIYNTFYRQQLTSDSESWTLGTAEKILRTTIMLFMRLWRGTNLRIAENICRSCTKIIIKNKFHKQRNL